MMYSFIAGITFFIKALIVFVYNSNRKNKFDSVELIFFLLLCFISAGFWFVTVPVLMLTYVAYLTSKVFCKYRNRIDD